MKISSVFATALMTLTCFFQSTTGETEALTLLRTATQTQSRNGPICYKICPTGQYCPRGETSCRAPTADLCFNSATSLFQKGCDLGFNCNNGKCVYKSSVPAGGAICYMACPTGQFCPRGETACRAPTGDLCFNPATSLFQHGCDARFMCKNGKCVYKATAPTTSVSVVESTNPRMTVHTQSPTGALCYKACPIGQYCPRGETECRAPTNDWCFNSAISLFQHGCARGFKCSYGKCVSK